MRPIPKRLLIHSAAIKGIETEDRWGNITTTEPIELTNIRLEPTKTLIRDKHNNEMQLNIAMIYDCKNSKPRDIEFTKDSFITINGVDHQIKTIEKLYDAKKLHHIELGLI